MYLLDTNIFLEILLGQNKEQECQEFINNNIGELAISDFSIYSIGIILFKNKLSKVFKDFIDDFLTMVRISSLPLENYDEVISLYNSATLDFDDSYHTALAQAFDFKVVTMDNDFKKVQDEIDIVFL